MGGAAVTVTARQRLGFAPVGGAPRPAASRADTGSSRLRIRTSGVRILPAGQDVTVELPRVSLESLGVATLAAANQARCLE